MQYSRTLVKSGILQNNGASLPSNPLQLQDILGMVTATSNERRSFQIKDLKGKRIWIEIVDFYQKLKKLDMDVGDVVIVASGKISYKPVIEPLNIEDMQGNGQ